MSTQRKPSDKRAAAMRKAYRKASWKGMLRLPGYRQDDPWFAFVAGAAWQRRQRRRKLDRRSR